MDQQNKVQVFQTAIDLTAAAGKLILELAKKSVETHGRFTIALSGGHTPEQLYMLLSKPPFSDQMPWDKTFIFWGDERCVPPDDPRNNAHMASTLLLDHIGIPSQNVFPVPVTLSPTAAATQYEQTIKDFFGEAVPGFDLILLGLGENGHTASIFPGSEAVFENTRLVTAIYVAAEKMFRVTMTSKLINQAQHIVFLVAGANKATILKEVLTTTYQPEKYPAQLIKSTHGALYWLADSEAATFLPH